MRGRKKIGAEKSGDDSVFYAKAVVGLVQSKMALSASFILTDAHSKGKFSSFAGVRDTYFPAVFAELLH